MLKLDDNPTAALNPESFGAELFDTNRMVITFFPEVMEKLTEMK